MAEALQITVEARVAAISDAGVASVRSGAIGNGHRNGLYRRRSTKCRHRVRIRSFIAASTLCRVN